jgi:DNA invertase Pin-like site-specific DNA recombinase
MPHAGTLEFGIRAVVAQHEREEISRRTKAALQAAKARGVKLGSPNPAAGSAAGIASIQASANQFAQRVQPIIADIIAKTGSTSLRSIAAALTARGVQTPRGGTKWGASQVANLMQRGAA